MDRAIENAARFAGLPLEDALRLANRQPRKLFPEAGAGIAPGERADLVLLREGPPLTVVATIVEGEVVFQQS
jgi:N-acetylglucosamine-6-phosphate deacetylase